MKEYKWDFEGQKEKVEILTPELFAQLHPQLFEKSMLSKTIRQIQFCQVLSYKGILSGNFVIPRKDHPIKDQDIFSFVLEGNTLYFIDYEDTVEKIIKRMGEYTQIEFGTVLMFLLDFMSFTINQDVYFLEEYNRQLEKIEMDMFDGKHDGVEKFIMTTRRDMNILASYYLQLSNTAETLENITIHDHIEEAQSLISLYVSRVSLLYSMVQQVKVYTDQIWNLRQTMLSDKQNQISRVLTIVSVLFLPLTLITGWFGMNFVHMPFIHTTAGYYGTLILCIIIVLIELLYIKKKGLWK